MKKLAIFGIGGFGREVFYQFKKQYDEIIFILDDKYFDVNINYFKPTIPLSKFNPKIYEAVVAVGDPTARSQIVSRFPKNTNWATLIHESVSIPSQHNIKFGKGSIICIGCILTTNITIGKHAHLNLHTTIGHDVKIGDFFTSSPGVNISGTCEISNRVYFGTNSSIREKLSVCDDVTIGLQAGVVKNITKPGIYVGVPAKHI